MKFSVSAWSLMCLFLLLRPCAALEIVFDYRYDTKGFFDQPGSKEALRLAGDFFEELIHDRLLEINTAEFPDQTWTAVFVRPDDTRRNQTITDLVVPADTLIVFVGSSDVAGATVGGPGGAFVPPSSNPAWLARVSQRGQFGAFFDTTDINHVSTDFAPWGGTISFSDSAMWDFTVTASNSTNLFDFIPVALHELGHLLGIGTAESWHDQCDGASFRGPLSLASLEGVPSLTTPTPEQGGFGRTFYFHWQENQSQPLLSTRSSKIRSFGQRHGRAQTALMVPTLYFFNDDFLVITDLELAALQDIGWEVVPPPSIIHPTINYLFPDQYELRWNSVTGVQFQVRKGVDLQSFPDLEGVFTGVAGQLSLLGSTDEQEAYFVVDALRPLEAQAIEAPLKKAAQRGYSTSPVMANCAGGDCDHQH